MKGTDPFGWEGSIIDDQFAVDAVAGEGAFGVVYRGTHLGLDMPVAIKCLKAPPGLTEDERRGVLATFRGEARLLHQLSRRTAGIVQALDVGSASSPSGAWTPYIVMEWLEGETLERDLRRRSASGSAQRSLDEAMDLLASAASALAVAHEENVSHRDVKPGNLFITSSRRGDLLKVVDFGIAKVLDETATRTGLSPTEGDRRFTARYAAPEQFSPEYGATGPWTDVYAMALILIEVVTGRFALQGETLIQIFTASIDERSRPSLRARGAAAAPEIEAVLARALAVHPGDRYRDMGEMWAAIEAARARSSSAGTAIGGLEATFDSEPLSAPREQQASPSTGERRICTVVFVDLSASTRLSARLDPEEVQEIVERCARAVTEQIAAMEGTSQALGSDRIMAIFGWPRATDSDAERAAHCALRIQAALGRVALPRAARAERIHARIGIDSGRVFTGGGTAGRPLTVIGDAVNIAAELQQAAPSGAIFVGRSTFRQIVGSFHVEPVAAAGGRLDAPAAHRLLGLAPSRPDLPPTDFLGHPTKFVGRASEVQAVLDAFEAVESEGRPRMLTFVGAPGAGRSRLLAELAARLKTRHDAPLLLTAQASPLGKDTSYGLAAPLIRRRFDLRDEDDLGAVQGKLHRGVRWFRAFGAGRSHAAPPRPPARASLDRAELDDALAQIALLLAREAASTHPGRSMTFADKSANPKHRICAAVAHLVDAISERTAVVLLCEDIHWADDASLDLLGYLADSATRRPLLVVCTARPDLLDRRPAWGEGAETQQRLTLGALARRHVEEMAKDRLRQVDDLPPDLLRLLVERAEGSPLTLTETLYFLVDAGVFEPRSTGAWSVRADKLGELSLPPTIQGVVQARLDRLDPEVHDALARAAVIGRTFWEGALDRLRHAGTSHAPPSPTAEILAQLRGRRIVHGREASTIPGEREYVFAESAMYEVAYETLGLKTRRTLHLAAAEWLDARMQGNAGAAQLALHYDRGGDPGRAAAAYARAATHAAALGGNDEVIRHLTRARALHEESRGDDHAGDVTERRVASWRDRVRVCIELGDVLRRTGKLDEAEPVYEQARAEILRRERRLGSHHTPAEALRWDARIDFRIGLLHKVRGALVPALAATERAIERAESGGSIEEIPAMYALVAFLHRRERRPDASWHAAMNGLRICRSLKRRGERWREDIAQLLFGIAASRYGHRRFVSAERVYRQAARMVSEAESPHLAGVALNGAAVSRIEQGDLRGTREMLLRSLRLKERAGDLHQIAIAYSNLADVELRLRDTRSALDHARVAVRTGEQARAGSDLADMYRNLAEASLAAGDVDAAITAGERALSIAEVAGRVYLPEVADSLTRICIAACSGAAEGTELRERAREAGRALARSFAKHFNEGDLLARAEACREALAPFMAGL
jgi:serine/threonine protein kinase/tetratricopeptide (TPR) repeat protein